MVRSRQFVATITFGVAALASGAFVLAAAGDISTVTGDGTSASTGDGGPASSAAMKRPHGLAFDAAGNLYISDDFGDVIRKIDSSGNISTVAGNGNATYGGDGGQAINASMETAQGIVFDSAGNLYISDADSYRVRKVATNGIITTYAGDGSGSAPVDGGQATASSVRSPAGLAIDSAGNLYIASPNTFRVRKVTPAGVMTTFAGDGTSGSSGDGGQANVAKLRAPYGLAFDPSGNLYITDTSDHVVRKVTPAGVISTFAGTSGSNGFSGDGSAATSAQLNTPRGITFDSAGNAFIADTGNNRIRKVDTNGDISTVVGAGTAGFSGDGGSATTAELNAPYGVIVDSAGNLIITDRGNRRVRKVSLLATPAPTTTTTVAPTTTTTTVAPTTTTIPVTSTTVANDTGVDGTGTESVGGRLPSTGGDSTVIVLFALFFVACGAITLSRRRAMV